MRIISNALVKSNRLAYITDSLNVLHG